jgi:hypothetical protein
MERQFGQFLLSNHHKKHYHPKSNTKMINEKEGLLNGMQMGKKEKKVFNYLVVVRWSSNSICITSLLLISQKNIKKISFIVTPIIIITFFNFCSKKSKSKYV